MTLKEMKKEYDRLGRLIREAEQGRFLKHEFIQAEFYPVMLPEGEIIKFRVKLYGQHTWRTIFYADGAKQAVADLERLRDALDAFLEDFRPWAAEKEECGDDCEHCEWATCPKMEDDNE
jgi:hypothetical protein